MTGPTDDRVASRHDFNLLWRLLAYLRPHAVLVAVAFVAMALASGAELAQPWLTQQAIDRFIATADVAGLGRLAAVLFVLLIVGFVAESVQTYLLQLVGQHVMHRLRLQVYARFQELEVQYFDRHPVGRLMTRATTDVDAINDLFTSGVVAVIGDVLMLAGITGVMVVMDWRLSLVAFSVLPLMVLTAHWFRIHVRQSYRRVRGLVARLNAFLQEHLTGMATVQLFNQQAEVFRRFDAINRQHRDVNVQSIFYYAVFYPVIELLAAVATALLIWVGGGWAIEGTVSLGVLVAFLQYSRRFFQPLADLSDKFNLLQAAMASAERVFGVLDTAPGLVPPARPRLPESPAQGRIEFDHVWFAYDAGNWVLKDVSFVVEPGQRVGIVGATGAGKTTVISLILRFYDATRGSVRVDGLDVRAWDPQALRARFGLVLQDVHLFSGTIADNIRLGNADITQAEVELAARLVHADTLIADRPGGYTATVAERGAGLSVGQKQLLSFARALALDPPVLLLDEATASIDTATEALIKDALQVIMQGRSVVAIAHRLSTIQDMDRILVFSHGVLRESGTHQGLLAFRGLYHRLYRLQYDAQAGRT